MSEAEAIAHSLEPVTRSSLQKELERLGLRAGDTVIVHTSLKKLGWVCGGAVAVIQALLDVLGRQGNLVMPAHSSGLTEPSAWQAPAVPAKWVQLIRDEMPAFDPKITPTRMMGATAELFRTWPGVHRSSHPAHSFAACGPEAVWITADHALEDGLGDGSPLGRLYELKSKVLLLGVLHGVNTSLHLAESRLGIQNRRRQGGPILNTKGQREWIEYLEPEYDETHFENVGQALDPSGLVRIGITGNTRSRLMSQPEIVDYVERHALFPKSISK